MVLAGIWVFVVSVGSHLRFENTAVHRIALFAHVLSLVVGFGAVVVVDVYGVLWILGLRYAIDIARLVTTGHALICLGLAGLLTSGILLEPDLASVSTRIKMVMVLAVLLNGLNAHGLGKRLALLPQRVCGSNIPWDLAWRMFVVSGVSQIGWWGAIAIGFLNTT